MGNVNLWVDRAQVAAKTVFAANVSSGPQTSNTDQQDRS